MICAESISAEVSISGVIKRLSDRERVLWVLAILETVQEEGTINLLREVINNPQWNDQPNHEKPTTQNINLSPGG